MINCFMAFIKLTVFGGFRWLVLVAFTFLLTPASAEPVVFQFSTNGYLSGRPEMVSLFPENSKVVGSFNYDRRGSFLGYSEVLGYDPGYAVYSLPPSGGLSAFSMLSGSVAGLSFSDVRGSFSLSDRTLFGGIPDRVSMNADPTLLVGANSVSPSTARQLVGFSIGDYTLINVRMFWADWSGAYLMSSDLLESPPLFPGILAFDFIRTADPTNTFGTPFYANTVFFSNLTVSKVPEPATYTLIALALFVVAWLARRRMFLTK